MYIYISVVKSSNTSSNRETFCAGYYVDKNTLIYDVIIRLELNLDVISDKLEWSPVPHLRKLL